MTRHHCFQTIALVVRPNTDGIAESVGSVVDFPAGRLRGGV
jgi:NAD+ kinase